MALQHQVEKDAKLFELMRKHLYTGVLCDTMDERNHREHAMDEGLRPIGPNKVIVGRAKTILAVDVYEVSEKPYELEIASVDSIKPGEVVIACTNGSRRTGFWGELLSSAAKARGATGAIIDGLVRDSERINELEFPVFARGFKPVDSRGRSRVIDYDCPVECGGVRVHPGDIIMADNDGVAVVPSSIAEDVIHEALDRAVRERDSKKALLAGGYLRDVYDRYGVL